MRQSSIGTVALGVFCFALSAQGAGPKPSEGQPAEVKATKAEAKANKAEAKANKAEAKAEAKANKAEAKAERAEAKADSKAERAAQGNDEADGNEHSDQPELKRGHGHHRSAMRELDEAVAQGKIDKAQVRERLGELRASREERQKEHRQALTQLYGKVADLAAVREELRHHARRSAFLNRALLVAQTEQDPKRDGGKTVERIEKLIEKENARHERAMQRFENEGGDGKAQLQKPKTSDLNAPAKGTEP